MATVFIACSDSGTGSDSGNDSIHNASIEGFSQKGPFVKGSSVHLYELEKGSMTQTGKSFLGKIKSDQGDFTIENIDLNSSFAMLEVNGYYQNEITGKNSNGTITLNAIADLKDRNQINVNLLTHLEFARVNFLNKEGMSIREAKDVAKAEIFSSFGAKNYDQNFEDLNVFENTEADAVLLAISILLQGNRSEAELTELLADYTADIEQDGTWDNFPIKLEIAEWAKKQISLDNFISIRKNVETIKGAAAPNFEKHIENFINMAFTCSPELEGNTFVLKNRLKLECKQDGRGEYKLIYLGGGLNELSAWTYLDGAVFDFKNGNFVSQGWWNMYSDGVSNIKWQDKMGEGYDAFQAIINTCEGICGELTHFTEYIGYKLNFSPDTSLSSAIYTDISSWGGLCVVSEGDLNVEIIPYDEETTTEFGNFYYRVSESGVFDIPWSSFAQPIWAKKSNIEQSLKTAVGIKFRLEKKGKFNLKAVGPMGTCGKPTSPNSSSSSQTILGDLWNGTIEGDYRVNTGYDNGSDESGYWYTYNDQLNGGSSAITWPVATGNAYDPDALDPIIDHCGGLCGTMSLGAGYEHPFAGIGFSLTGSEDNSADITDWGGLCLVYTANQPLKIELESDNSKYTYNNYSAELAANEASVRTCLNWSKFKQESGLGQEISQEEFLKQVTSIRIVNSGGKVGSEIKFNIMALGKYSSEGI